MKEEKSQPEFYLPPDEPTEQQTTKLVFDASFL